MAEITLELKVNGTRHRLRLEGEASLLSVLRNDLGLTGTKYGCGEAQCGACTVLVDGLPKRSCVTPVRLVQEREITTIEGLAPEGRLHPLQEAFLEAGALECGYCTPGMIMSAAGLLRNNSQPSREQIRHHLQGNICRCGTYRRILEAVERAAARMRGETS